MTVEAGERAAPRCSTPSSQAAFEGLDALAAARRPAPPCCTGVTGSGKTQVYLRLIYEALPGPYRHGAGARDRPDPQLLRIFASHFGDDIAVLHSSLRAGSGTTSGSG